MSAEMYTFHEVIDELQRAEEEVLDNHKAVSDYLQLAVDRSKQLLSITRDVDYDQDGQFPQSSVLSSCCSPVFVRLADCLWRLALSVYTRIPAYLLPK